MALPSGHARVVIENETFGELSLMTRLTILASPHPIRDGETSLLEDHTRLKGGCQISNEEGHFTVLKNGRDAPLGLVPVHKKT